MARFDYRNRAQSDGRVKCNHCCKVMLGIDEQDPRTWSPLELKFLDNVFCDCHDEVILNDHKNEILTRE